MNTFKGAESSPGVADVRSIQTPVVLTGHASATGSAEHNLRLSEERVASVADFMQAEGFVNVITRVSGEGVGETEATGGEVAEERRVDIVIGSGNAQSTIAHEFGHAFGLGDEYANTPLVSPGLGRDTGTPQMGDTATHDTLVKNMIDAGGQPLKGAVCEPTDSIMSVGDVVRPQHYATFHASLTEITAPQGPWALGPPTGRNDPLPGAAAAGESGPGDFPVRPGRGRAGPRMTECRGGPHGCSPPGCSRAGCGEEAPERGVAETNGDGLVRRLRGGQPPAPVRRPGVRGRPLRAVQRLRAAAKPDWKSYEPFTAEQVERDPRRGGRGAAAGSRTGCSAGDPPPPDAADRALHAAATARSSSATGRPTPPRRARAAARRIADLRRRPPVPEHLAAVERRRSVVKLEARCEIGEVDVLRRACATRSSCPAAPAGERRRRGRRPAGRTRRSCASRSPPPRATRCSRCSPTAAASTARRRRARTTDLDADRMAAIRRALARDRLGARCRRGSAEEMTDSTTAARAAESII